MIRSELLRKIPSISVYSIFKRNYEFKYGNIPQRDPAGENLIVPKNFGTEFAITMHKKWDFSMKNMRRIVLAYAYKELVYDQRFIYDRHKVLGANLATAHFVIYRGGSVKFHGDDHWIRLDPEDPKCPLPSSFVPNYYLEAIDLSNSNLLYEGMDNLINLFRLKSLNLSKCKYIDDWCLDRMYQFGSVEHLDISGCPLVTERGICTLTKMRNLKTICLSDLPKASNLELVSMLLEDALPNLKVVGVDYMALAPKYLEPT